MSLGKSYRDACEEQHVELNELKDKFKELLEISIFMNGVVDPRRNPRLCKRFEEFLKSDISVKAIKDMNNDGISSLVNALDIGLDL